jgi:hypothetical protein
MASNGPSHKFRFTIREVLIYLTGFCIATAAIAALPGQQFILPVGLMTATFLLIGQRKAGFAFCSWFVGAWLIAAAGRTLFA